MNGWLGWAKEFLIKYEPKIALVLGFVLVAVISFEVGIIKGHQTQEKPVIIEKPAQSQVLGDTQGQNPPQAQNLASEATKVPEAVNKPAKDCAFVGSKNSNKYHLPTCSSAKRIKPENIVCFKSAEDAASRGYQPDKGCVK